MSDSEKRKSKATVDSSDSEVSDSEFRFVLSSYTLVEQYFYYSPRIGKKSLYSPLIGQYFFLLSSHWSILLILSSHGNKLVNIQINSQYSLVRNVAKKPKMDSGKSPSRKSSSSSSSSGSSGSGDEWEGGERKK